MTTRDRIKELRRVKAAELQPNPKNWRVHPQSQRNALMSVLAEIGYADALLAYECDAGGLRLIDGHLRAETTPDQLVPVLILDVNDAEADLILATLDPLAGLAAAESTQLESLLDDLGTISNDVDEMLADLARQNGLHCNNTADADDFDQSGLLTDKFEVLVECDDDQQQAELIDRLRTEGYTCRALIA